MPGCKSWRQKIEHLSKHCFTDFRLSDIFDYGEIESRPKDIKIQTGIFFVYSSQNMQKSIKKW